MTCEHRNQRYREVHYCNNSNWCKNQFNYGGEKYCKIPLIEEADKQRKKERLLDGGFEKKINADWENYEGE